MRIRRGFGPAHLRNLRSDISDLLSNLPLGSRAYRKWESHHRLVEEILTVVQEEEKEQHR